MADFNAQLNQVENGAAFPISDGGNQLGSEQKLQRATQAGAVFETRATPGNGSTPDPNLRTHEGNIRAGIKTRVDQIESGDPRQFREVSPGGTSFINNGDIAAVQTQGNTNKRDNRAENAPINPYSIT